MKQSRLLENLLSNRITFLKVSLLMLLALSMVQCSFKKDDEGGKDPQIIIKEQVETGTVKGANISLQLVPEEKVHVYSIQINWAIPSNCMGKIQKRAEKSAFADVWLLEEASGNLLDANVVEATKYFYTLICTVNGAEKSVETLSLTVPQDLTLEGNLNLKEMVLNRDVYKSTISNLGNQIILKAPRIQMASHLQLKTFGLNFTIDTDFLEAAAGSRIATFDGDPASSKEPGKSGGHLQIKANKGRGSLDIRMNGQDGGPGEPISEIMVTAEPSKRGEKGQDAIYTVVNESWLNPSVRASCLDALNGSGLPAANCKVISIQCVQPAQSGQTGGAGKLGLPGNNGFNGGLSGTAEIQVLSGDIKFNLSKRGGKGGSGGPGGLGTDGGDGGPAGNNSLEYAYEKWKASRISQGQPTAPLSEFANNIPCTGNPTAGLKGPNGNPGPQGGPGLNGFEEKSFIYNPATQKTEEL